MSDNTGGDTGDVPDGSVSIEVGKQVNGGEYNVGYQPDYLEETIPPKPVDTSVHEGETR